ncbi:glycosyl hydrolase [Chitinivorax sp. B]|uniref:glycosyl hydrolase n=1 Tax=Chitinivorax sp. B TaxID=2502235 RepID=UPI0010F7B54A|nr:glycosyl hydrolase [Chitinivorax sp. B]
MKHPLFCLSLCVLAVAGAAQAADIPLGMGSYSDTLKVGTEKLPPRQLFVTPSMKGAIPSNGWESSLITSQWSHPLFTHPVSYQAKSSGFEIGVNNKLVVGQPDGEKDILYPHTPALNVFPLGFTPQDARADKVGHWSVDLVMGNDQQQMKATIVKGSPFSYYQVSSGDVKLSAMGPHEFFYRDAKTVGVKIHGKPFAIFLPNGASVTGFPDPQLTVRLPEGARYFSIAALPEASTTTINEFRNFAYNFVTDTKVDWRYDEASSQVITTFSATTQLKEGADRGTLFGLYPHQWGNGAGVPNILAYQYDTIRGRLKLVAGKQFQTRYAFTGVLPIMPPLTDANQRKRLADYVAVEHARRDEMLGDPGTYWLGKNLAKMSTLMLAADQQGDPVKANDFMGVLKNKLQDWFKSNDNSNRNYFHYDRRWGALIGYPEEYGSGPELNDHHFHYGYWVNAAAHIALRDPAWASPNQWGGMVNLLIRDFANSNQADAQFPFLRNFDPYEGHAWASGTVPFGDGNNQESSSEAMNAWAGMILWGEATGNKAVRDAGIYMYTTEMQAINNYWFDLDKRVFAPDYPNLESSMIWGDKYVHTTFWTDDPLEVHGINMLPLTNGSFYLATKPDFVKRNFDAAYREYDAAKARGAQLPSRDTWRDILLNYYALYDGAAALSLWNDSVPVEGGETRAHTYHWLQSLANYGQPDLSVTANTPLYAVFKSRSGKRAYAAFNASDATKTVTFSDGKILSVPPRQFATSDGNVQPPSSGDPVAEGGYVLKIAATDKCIDVIGASKVNGTKVQQWTCNGTAAQTFHITAAADRIYRLTNANSGKVWDVEGRKTTSGAPLLQWDSNGGLHQQFIFKATGIHYVIRARHSNLCLEVNGNGDGVPLTQANCTGAVKQQFKLVSSTTPTPVPPYGVTQTGQGVLQFHVKDVPWADVHFVINNQGQMNYRMQAGSGMQVWSSAGLKAGDSVKYFFTIGKQGGGAIDTDWQSVIVN